MENSIMGLGPPPQLWKTKIIFFLKLDHFFQKMIKLLLDKQIFASSDARFCCDMCNDGRNTQNFGHNMCNFRLDMTWLCHLSMYL